MMKLRVILIAAFAAILTAGQAYALCIASTGVSSVTPEPSGTFEYLVSNGCNTVDQPLLDDFFIPYFSDAGISDITTPDGWTYSIEPTNNVFDLPGAGVIEFDATPAVGYFGGDFSYTASYSAGIEGPFLMDLTKDGNSYQVSGDPLIPASPDALNALGSAAVPEPSSIGLLTIGFCAIVLVAKRVRHARGFRRSRL